MNQPHLEPVPSPPHPCLAWGKACLCHQPDAHSSLDPLSKQLTSKVTTSSLSTRELNWYSALSPEQTWLWPAFVLNKQQLIPSFTLTCKGRRLHFAGSKVQGCQAGTTFPGSWRRSKSPIPSLVKFQVFLHAPL